MEVGATRNRFGRSNSGIGSASSDHITNPNNQPLYGAGRGESLQRPALLRSAFVLYILALHVLVFIKISFWRPSLVLLLPLTVKDSSGFISMSPFGCYVCWYKHRPLSLNWCCRRGAMAWHYLSISKIDLDYILLVRNMEYLCTHRIFRTVPAQKNLGNSAQSSRAGTPVSIFPRFLVEPWECDRCCSVLV